MMDLQSEINKRLNEAIFSNDLEVVRGILNGSDSSTIEKPQTGDLLYQIIRSKEMVQLLIANGADPGAKNQSGSTPLHYAVTFWSFGGSKVVYELLKNGANINQSDGQGNTPLYCTSRARAIEDLILYGADVNWQNLDGYTKFQVALMEKKLEASKMVLKHMLIKNPDGYNFFEYSIPPYVIFCDSFNKLSKHRDECIAEISLMKQKKMSPNFTLYDFCRTNNMNKLARHISRKNKVNRHIYPNYSKLIMARFRFGKERARLLKELERIRICYTSKLLDVTINHDCKLHIVAYLNNFELAKFINAHQL